jgi:hypothetical protein
MLTDERPSRALSLLQFAITFAANPGNARQIALPRYIAVDDDGSISLRTPAPATSFVDAEQSLRAIMGVGADIRVPLAVD